ncbi:hypothetical protein [Halovulum sp. GXIMD14793]
MGAVIGYFSSNAVASLAVAAAIMSEAGTLAEFLFFLPLLYIGALVVCLLPFLLLRYLCNWADRSDQNTAMLAGAMLGLIVAGALKQGFGWEDGFGALLPNVLFFCAIGTASGWVQWVVEQSFEQHRGDCERSHKAPG